MGKTTIVKGNVFLTTGGNFKVHSNENIENHSQKQVIQKGADKGVTHNKPKTATLTDLRVTKVEGPFDENGKLMDKIGFEKFYTYKATPSRKPTEAEVKLLKWATKNDNGVIKELGGVASNNQLSNDGKIIISIAINIDCEKARVYAFYKKANESVSVNVTMIEPLIIFVNGYWNNSYLQKDLLGFSDGKYQSGYWGEKLRNEALKYFKTTDNNMFFLNGASTAFSSGEERYNKGEKFASDRKNNHKSKFHQAVFKEKRNLFIVSHSMGGAFAEGVLEVLKAQNLRVKKVVHLSPADCSDFKVNYSNLTYQLDISWDPVISYKNINDQELIKGVKYAGLVQNPDHDHLGHAYTKLRGYVWNWFEDLEKITFTFNRSETKYERLSSDGLGPTTTIKLQLKIYSSHNTKHNTQFIKVYKQGKYYHFHSNNEYEG